MLMNGIKFVWGTKLKKWIKEVNPNQWIAAGGCVLLLLMGIIHALGAGRYVDFNPINGTFQNYNPVRRLLNNQIPYRDFQDYLGLGHLYAGSLFTALLGGNYRSSLIAFQLLAFLSVALTFYFISRIILKKNASAFILTNILMVILLIRPSFLETLAGDPVIEDALEKAIYTGNSARMLRGMILPLSCLIIIFAGDKIKKAADKINNHTKRTVLLSVFSGLLAGVCFPWSNDYGIGCWLCLLIMTFFVGFSKDRHFFKSFVCLMIAAVSSLISLFMVIEITTVGHFSKWFSDMFGTGGYQSWYYNTDSKSFYIFDMDFSYLMLIQAFLCIVYLIKVWKAKGEANHVMRHGILAYANMVCFCVTNEYKLLSGGSSREVAHVVLFGTIIAEMVYYIGNTSLKIKSKSVFGTASAVICLAWILSTCHKEFEFYFLTERKGVYINQMGGNLTSLGEDLLSTAYFLDNKRIFATYASAQELISGNFQPSGTDYVIHALGDQQREEYLQSFENDDFDYAVTINENFSAWEFWIQRANWFFYRSLLENWHPVYANSYAVYWERNTKDHADSVYRGDIKINIIQIDSSTQKITVETGDKINGTADVLVHYAATKKNNISSKFLYTSMVYEQNTGELVCTGDRAEFFESAYLRSQNTEYIPVTVTNGYGEVTLTSKPEKSTCLDLKSAACSQVYETQYQYIQIYQIEEQDHVTALYVLKDERSKKILDKISAVEIEGNVYEVQKTEDNCLLINNRGIHINEELLKTNNMLRVEQI